MSPASASRHRLSRAAATARDLRNARAIARNAHAHERHARLLRALVCATATEVAERDRSRHLHSGKQTSGTVRARAPASIRCHATIEPPIRRFSRDPLSSVFDLLISLDSTRFKDQARSTMRREHRCNGDDAQSTDLSLTPANVDRASLLSSLSLSVSPQPQLLIGSIVEQNRNYPRRSARRREEPTPPFPATGRARVSRDRSLIPRSKFKVNVKTARLAHTPRRQGRIDTRRVAVRIRGTCRRANSTQLV